MQFDSHDRDQLIGILKRIPDLKDPAAKETFCVQVFGDTATSRIAKLVADTGTVDFATLVVQDVLTIADPNCNRRCLSATRELSQNTTDQDWLDRKLLGFSNEAIELFEENDLILNPYLIDHGLIERVEESWLDEWLMNKADHKDRFLCITDFGGAGKTALVWKWLKSYSVRVWRYEHQCQLFWSTFYARNYDSLDFLRKMAIKLNVDCVDASGTPLVGGHDDKQILEFRQAWSTLIASIVNKLANVESRWLIVLDGLEREMGRYADPSNQAYDSQAQDTRKETDQHTTNRFHPDYDIRRAVFAEFLDKIVRGSNDSLRMIATSRLMPNNVPKFGGDGVGFRELPLGPFDAERLWKDITGLKEADGLARKFFAQVDRHPQIVSIVAEAFNASGQETFKDWLEDIEKDHHLFLQELEKEPGLTNRRHRWLDVATRDLVERPMLWGLLCRVACNPGESSIRSLYDTARKLSGGEFRWDYGKTKLTLKQLQERRLVGIGRRAQESSDSQSDPPDFVDVHPVVRCHIYQYAVKLHQKDPLTHSASERLIHGVIKQAESDSGLFLGLVDPRNYEEKLLQIQDRYGTAGPKMDGSENFDTIWDKYFQRFYPKDDLGLDPRMLMPAVRVRKNQAYISLQSAHLFTRTGRWDESMQAYQIAEMTYKMAGDLESSVETRRCRTWQQLYGGSLFDFEKYFVDRYLNDKARWNPQSDPLWLAIGLAVRRAPETASLLESIEAFCKRGKQGWTRWEAQTVAECWYYLAEKPEDCVRPIRMIEELKDEARGDGAIQRVWEFLTQGICYLEQGDTESAKPFLQQALEDSNKKNDAVTSNFAQAYLVELEAAIAEKELNEGRHSKMIDAFVLADKHYGKYQQRDSHGRFQIPATIASLGISRARFVAAHNTDKKLLLEALEYAQRAARIAAGAHPQFGFGLGLNKAKKITAQIDEKSGDASSSEKPSISHLDLRNHKQNLTQAIQSLLKELSS